MKHNIAIVRGKFLNAYEMQFFEPLCDKFSITAFGSLHPYHDSFRFPVVKLPSPMDLPEFPLKMPLLNRLFVDAHYLLGLEKKLQGFDLVHTAETYYHYTQQCLNAKRNGAVKKVIATVLENIPFNNEGIWGRKRFKERSRRELDHIIALTEKTKDTLITEGADPKKITVISHFVNSARFAPSYEAQKRRAMVKKRDFVILFTGRFEEYKGVFTILVALSEMRRDAALQGYTIWMIFAGEGSQKNMMQAYAVKHGLADSIVYKHVSYSQMPALYDQADIFVAPSAPTPTYDEQYCTALLEAQAAGLPIVTTRTGGIPENVGSAAVLISPRDSHSLAYALKNYMLHSEARRRYAHLARSRAVRIHDVKIGARKMAALYETILSS